VFTLHGRLFLLVIGITFISVPKAEIDRRAAEYAKKREASRKAKA